LNNSLSFHQHRQRQILTGFFHQHREKPENRHPLLYLFST
jgi:hypothetical protein